MEKLKTAAFMLSIVPEVIGELICDTLVWLDQKIDDALDVWDD